MTTVALIGNPNCGKSTLYNRLTGAHRPVGNLPGVTVDIERAPLRGKPDVQLWDLPGLYSLYPASEEEAQAVTALEQRPDILLNVVDATHLSRHLYLTWQLLWWGIPLVVALNFRDRVEEAAQLATRWQMRLGVPVIPISAGKGQGLAALRQALTQATVPPPPPLAPAIETVLRRAETLLTGISLACPHRFAAMAVLDGDARVCRQLPTAVVQEIRHLGEMWREPPYDPDMRLAKEAYGFIDREPPPLVRPDISARVDRVLTHRVWGLLCFFLLAGGSLWLLFGTPGQWLGAFFGGLTEQGIAWLSGQLETVGVHPFWRRLLCEGLLAGVGTTLQFCPQLLLLFGVLAVWEDTGYLARAALVWDSTLGRCGLTGRAILPLLCGFGCTVPAVMATRTLSRDADRRTALSLLPFCSCSAKIPVYLLLCAAFFPQVGMLPGMLYLLGCLGALLQALWEQRRRKEPRGALLLELPPYRFPTPTALWAPISRRMGEFLSRVTTVLVLSSTLLFLLQHVDAGLHLLPAGGDASLFFRIGGCIAPLLAPFGCDHPAVAVALLTGLFAKEGIVTALGQSATSGGLPLTASLTALLSPDAAAALLVFVLLYSPCAAALAAVAKERSKKVALWWFVRQNIYAYLAAVMTYTLLRWI